MQYSYTVSKERRTSIIDDALSDDDRRHVINDSGTKEEEREKTSVLVFFLWLMLQGRRFDWFSSSSEWYNAQAIFQLFLYKSTYSCAVRTYRDHELSHYCVLYRPLAYLKIKKHKQKNKTLNFAAFFNRFSMLSVIP